MNILYQRKSPFKPEHIEKEPRVSAHSNENSSAYLFSKALMTKKGVPPKLK
jgi:hypothetical protein